VTDLQSRIERCQRIGKAFVAVEMPHLDASEVPWSLPE
jgi:hypothetical protein